ncbi:hypothetical protein F5887DRAFT_916097 [Amanita rubescens]|nr:hypothetical protein F5887DRAFT_916097 [Amanita rubescens]
MTAVRGNVGKGKEEDEHVIDLRRVVANDQDTWALVGKYLPPTLTEKCGSPYGNFAYLRLPTSGTRSIVALSSTMPQVMYLYNIDLDNSGEWALVKQYDLLDSTDDSNVNVRPLDDGSGSDEVRPGS